MGVFIHFVSLLLFSVRALWKIVRRHVTSPSAFKCFVFTCTFLKMSVSHMLSFRTTPFLSSASFLLKAKSSSHLFSGVLAWPKTCRAMRNIQIVFRAKQQTRETALLTTKAHKQHKLTLSNMRLRRRGTTGKTVGWSVFRSSIKSRMSPWK